MKPLSAFLTLTLGGAALVSLPASAQTGTTPATTPAATAPATANPTVGGAEMVPTKTIVENAAAANNLKTLVSAVKAAGLDATLSGPGPFTVFAPTDSAFARLAPGTVDTLLKPENKPLLTKVLTYHVIAGALDAQTLAKQLTEAGGTLTLTTVAGDPITAKLENNAVVLNDVNGNKSYVTQYDVKQANGIVHVVNGVLIPRQDAPAAAPAETPAE
ncbi:MULTISPECIES: fasciclin domain-containing protein [unclassified Sphingomonas]|jgi:uncharacterized surface protein with fasciclin (FAS1) repeats|uniref:fasciclin domain-containing protein n=1 Tax=unclassified Sphingomonas TaxID=196159 RepID=UPI0009E8AC13|nr:MULTISPECIES: fasciclin domain-containing protein [unclassified Sphingomonas]